MLLDELAAVRDDAGTPPVVGSFIGGQHVLTGSGMQREIVDPATGRHIASIEEAGAEGVARAVDAGQAAFGEWRRMPTRDRAALVSRLGARIAESAEALAQVDTMDTGNPITAMRADVVKGIRQLSDASGLALEIKGQTFPVPGLHYTIREPWGVVGRMITFNHPAMFTCARLGPALIAGNCVLLKPSELAPLSAVAIAELTAGLLPDGVVNVVVGGPETGAALVRHPAIERLSFTGSTATALRIQAAAAESGHVKTLSFELGGKNPVVVFGDVDVEEAAAAVIRGMNFTRVQGQSCGSTSRLVIHTSVARAVLDRVAALARAIRIGLPADPRTEMGSMISASARDRCVVMVERSVEAGARVTAGGRVPADPDLAGGAFLEPTVVEGVDPDADLALEEVFGPVLAAMTFETEAEALELANAGRYGLTAAIWTNDLDRALRMVDGVRAGYVWVNDVETRFPAVPFGGWGDSGVGVEHGLEEILSFTRTRSVNIRVR